MKAYAAQLERELAARLLRKALSAEPDFTEEGNARVSVDRFNRTVDDLLNGRERVVLVGPDGGVRT